MSLKTIAQGWYRVVTCALHVRESRVTIAVSYHIYNIYPHIIIACNRYKWGFTYYYYIRSCALRGVTLRFVRVFDSNVLILIIIIKFQQCCVLRVYAQVVKLNFDEILNSHNILTRRTWFTVSSRVTRMQHA